MTGPAANDDPSDRLILGLDGYEGPIDLLLTLARERKVDLLRLPILPVAEQYLAFVARAGALRIELAADYLVMAAWLAYLKSRLLLPEPPAPEGEEPSPIALAEALAFQLRRLEGLQEAARRLAARPLLGHGIRARGAPEGIALRRRLVPEANLAALIEAWADRNRRALGASYAPPPLDLESVEAAMARLEGALGRAGGAWRSLAAFLPPGVRGLAARAALAATFGAALELARRGVVELSQSHPFGELRVRRATPLAPDPQGASP